MNNNIVKTEQEETIVRLPVIYQIPLIGERAAPFKAETTKGPINFPFDYAGKWVIFFSHPTDFEPVCTTEFMIFQSMQEEFKALNTELLGLSVNQISCHLEWIQSIYQIEWDGLENVSINFPIIADPCAEIATKYGMIHRGESNTNTVRALFIIDPDAIVRCILYYGFKTGRNLEEVKRTLQALQVTAAEEIATPANWEPFEPVILPEPQTTRELIVRLQEDLIAPSIDCKNWYLCFRDLNTETAKKLGYDRKIKIPKPINNKTFDKNKI
jgi:peroxiredoxin 2/4